MRYPNDYYEDEHGSKGLLIQMIIIMTFVVAIIVGLIIVFNNPNSIGKNQVAHNKINVNEKEVPLKDYISGSTLTSDQLNIWTLPEQTKETASEADNVDGIVINETTGELVSEGKIAENQIPLNDAPNEVNQTLITTPDGMVDLVDINPQIQQNEFLLSGFSKKDSLMMYTQKGEKLSKTGVLIDSKCGVIDFFRLKALGCDFVLVRVGCRGYSSGKIVLDDKYKDYIDSAKQAGLGVGAYFISQAINKEEILDEVDTVVEALGDYAINYPVLVGYEMTNDDVTRIDSLDKEEKTKLLHLFLSELKEASYQPVIYGTKDWLLMNINLEELSDFDISFSQKSELPDFPYNFKMWEYDTEGKIGGILQPAKLIIYMQ